jgi:hypothetical protein
MTRDGSIVAFVGIAALSHRPRLTFGARAALSVSRDTDRERRLG